MADDPNINNKYLDVATSQKQFFTNYANVLGAVAKADPEPYSSLFIEILAVVAQLGALFSPDPVESAINGLFKLLHGVFVTLGAEDAALQLSLRTGFQNRILAQVSSAVNDIQLAIDHPDRYPPGTLILHCQTALNTFLFDNDPIWNITYLAADFEKLYWTDQGR